MKIAMIGLRGIPGVSGGIETAVENLAPNLAKLGVDVTVYCRPPYSNKKITRYKGVQLKHLPSLNTKYTETIFHSSISTLNASLKDYDIVHFHAIANTFFTIIPRATGKRTVLTIHGLDWEREKWGILAKSYLRICEKFSARWPDQVISVSDKIKNYYKREHDKNIIYIPNGVNPASTSENIEDYNMGLKHKSYILFLSRIVPEKGLHYLIEAFKQVKTNTNLVIVGDSSHTSKYFAEVKKISAGDNRIIFVGPRYGSEKNALYNSAKFFVLPSTIEGMPIVLLEAMSHGLTPLVSDIEENIEVITNLGYNFRSKDVEDLRLKITYMLKNEKKLKIIGMRCKKHVLKNYSWESIAKKTLKVYEDLLHDKR